MRGFGWLLMIVALALPAAALAQETESVTHWKVTFQDEEGEQYTLFLLKVVRKEGKLTGSTIPLRKLAPTALAKVESKGERFGFQLKIGSQTWDFEGKLPQAGGKKIQGSFLLPNGEVFPAWLETTSATDAFELDRELLLRSPNDPRVFQAARRLFGQAPARKAPAKEVQEWLETAMRAAESYGPRWHLQTTLRLAETLVNQEGYAAVAAQALRSAEQAMDPKGPADQQVRLLAGLVTAWTKAGQQAQAQEAQRRLDKVEARAYREYHQQSPPFKVAKFLGRKAKSERAVLIELFTGAQCPPCLAADLAFDAVEKAYGPSEVVLLQYHLHIPGPDPLANPDTEDRAQYYGEETRGTPAIFFNGKVGAPGGGGRDDAEEKFQEYRAVLGPLLEKTTALKLQAQAGRQGDKVTIKALVRGLDKPGDKMRLRLALVEDWVRYRGGNGLPYHHRVVRALPGGAKGWPLQGGESTQTATVNLAELRTSLHKYLDELVQNGALFSNPQRPMRFGDLRVVAFVQNDETREILQAVEAGVKEE